MGGNLSQWCEDWYDSEQKYRVLRGGAWITGEPRRLLSSYRLYRTPTLRHFNLGFRVVLVGGSARKVSK